MGIVHRFVESVQLYWQGALKVREEGKVRRNHMINNNILAHKFIHRQIWQGEREREKEKW